MNCYDELVYASAEERDALCPALAEDLAEASGHRRAAAGFLRAERPRDLARALGRDRRERPQQRRVG